jgi:LysM repeat protein
MLPRPAVAALAPSSLLVSLALLWGCTGSSPGNDPNIRRRFDILTDAIAEIQGDLESNRETITSLAAQVQTGGTGGAPSAEIATLQASNQELQRSIAELRQQLAQLSSRLDDARGGHTAAASNAAPAEHSAATPPEPQSAAPETAQAEPVPESSQSEARASDAAQRMRGFYHTYAEDESLASIAAQYSIDVATLLQANALPPNARVLPGQQIFIPQGG